MPKTILAAAACAALFSVSCASAATLPFRYFTVDGTWDCKDETGVRTGTIVLANTAYAFIKTDGKLGGYGELAEIVGDFWLKFVVTNGYLKDEMNVIGFAGRGPENDPEDFRGEIYLFSVVGIDSKHHWDCARRGGRENAPPA